jgi:HAD superfamily hydrolase (TIGR01509 family)
MAGPFQLVIFDCDGVLVDSERLAVRVEAALLAELGWPLSEAEVVERFMGRTQAVMAEAVRARLGAGLPADWQDRLDRGYHAAFDAELAPVDGVVEALDRITIPTCVASSGSHETIRRTLRLTGLYHRFEGRIFSAAEVAEGKPAPDLFLHAAARMGAEPAACAVVEDSRYGVQAARAAGMRAFGYTGGLTPPERLAGPGTVLFDDMRQLPELLAAAATDGGRHETRGTRPWPS